MEDLTRATETRKASLLVVVFETLIQWLVDAAAGKRTPWPDARGGIISPSKERRRARIRER
jgi:hypothetical protein